MSPLDVFLMSPPRLDWRIRGQANVFSRAADGDIEEGAALAEWIALADAICDAGGEIVVVENDADASLTGMPYTAEAGHLGDVAFLLPNVKPAHRRGERLLLEKAIASWGLETRAIRAAWEGQGDVIDLGGKLVCTSGEGPDARSAREAYDEVAPLLGAPSIHLRFRADPWFHGNTFLASYEGASGRVVVVCDEALLRGEGERLRAFASDARFVSIRRDESLKYATNALQVNQTIIAPRGAPDVVRRLWQQLGLALVEVPLPTLFERGGGGPVCLTNRLSKRPARATRFGDVRVRLVAELHSIRGSP